MSVVVEGVPESITRAQFVSWLAQIGLEPSALPRDATLRFADRGSAISVEVFARDVDGRLYGSGEHYVDADGTHCEQVARHTVWIPITEE